LTLYLVHDKFMALIEAKRLRADDTDPIFKTWTDKSRLTIQSCSRVGPSFANLSALSPMSARPLLGSSQALSTTIVNLDLSK
jgi:hypothetical protein